MDKARLAARHKILAAANLIRERIGTNPRPYRMRHLQLAVAVVRRRRFVSRQVLIDAGFRPW